MSRPNLLLAALGGLSLLVYTFTLAIPFSVFTLGDTPLTSFAQETGRTVVGVAHFVVALLVPFVFYVAAVLVCRAGRVSIVLVFGFVAAAGALLLVVYPLTAIDAFLYGAQARVLVHHGANPYLTPPASFPGDPYLNWTIFRDVTSAYGPLWMYLASIPTALAGDDPMRAAIGMKALALIALLASALIAYSVAERQMPGSGPAAACLLGWNPLLLWSAAGDGHNDIVMTVFILVAFFCMQRLPMWSLPALTLAAAVKFTAVLLAPLFIIYMWRQGHSPMLMGGSVALAGAVGMALFAPFWGGFETASGLLGQATDMANMSPGAIVLAVLDQAGAGDRAATVARLVFYGAFVAGYAAVLGRLIKRGHGLADASFTVMLLFLLIATLWFRFWYLTWLVALAAMLPPDRVRSIATAIVFSASALLVYLFTDYLWVWLEPGLTNDIPAVLVVFLSPLLVWLVPVRAVRPARRTTIWCVLSEDLVESGLTKRDQ